MFGIKKFKDYLKETEEIGFVEEVVSSIAYVSGLPGARLLEIVIFESGNFGQVFSIDESRIEVILLSENFVKVGEKVTRTNLTFNVSVGEWVLGKCISPLGTSVSGINTGKISSQSRPVDILPPGIDARKKVNKFLHTGVTVVDMMIPIGRGQRELIIGDRKTGKTNFLLQTALTQAKQGTICVYAAIGKKKLDIKKIEEFFIKNKIDRTSVIIASSSQDTSGKIFLTPYTAMAVAEYFKDQGKDVLVILDDLSTHAKFYREIALLGKKFPGRNSYPGDMFYVHAKLLERSGNFAFDGKESSITCLPVVETTQGDLSGYIQTNIMSMTDGHIYFDHNLFSQGRRPAINIGLSVTRVGHQTQTDVKKQINRELTSFLSLYERMQNYMHFGAELNESSRNILSTGDKILQFFDQSAKSVIPVNVQTFLFGLLWFGAWQEKETKIMKEDMGKIIERYIQEHKIKDLIDKLVEQSKSFNNLLDQIRGNLENLSKELDIILEPKTQNQSNQESSNINPKTEKEQTNNLKQA